MSFRVGGLISGLDTHGLINQLMELERKPLESLQARNKELENRRAAWQGISSRINTLETALTKLAKIFKDSPLSIKSSSQALSAAITGSAQQGTWQVKIERLAEARAIASDAFTEVGAGEFFLNGFRIQLAEGAKLSEIVAAINGAGASRYEFIPDSAGEVEVTGTYRGDSDAQLRVEVQDADVLVYRNGELAHTFAAALDVEGSGSVVYAGLKISFSQALTGDSVEIQGIAAKETGYTASAIDGRLVLNSANHEPIEFSDPQGILQQMGILDALGAEKNVLVEGSTALVRINGLLVERDSNVIKDALPGMTLNLHQAGEELIELTAEFNGGKIKEALEDIVGQINALTKTLGQGSLVHDTMAYRLKDSLHRALSSVTGTQSEAGFLAAIGISTDRFGTVHFSQDKLESVLGENFSALEELITGEKGLVENLKSACQVWAGSSGLIKTRLETYSSQIRSNESSILRAEERLEMRRQQLWRQFTAMERALSTLESQGNWLAGQLNSLPGYQK